MGQSFYRSVASILEDHGCYVAREGKGSHRIWYSPINGKYFPVPTTIQSHHTTNGIMKQAGIRHKF